MYSDISSEAAGPMLETLTNVTLNDNDLTASGNMSIVRLPPLRFGQVVAVGVSISV